MLCYVVCISFFGVMAIASSVNPGVVFTYIEYSAVKSVQNQLDCRFALFGHIHHVLLCAMECTDRDCVYFTMNSEKTCVLCENDSVNPSPGDVGQFGITGNTDIFIHRICKFLN